MSATYKVFKEEKLAKEIRPKCLKYLKKSLLLSNLKKINVKDAYSKKKFAKKILNLNHNGALLPKFENQKEFFSIFEEFKSILNKKISNNSLIHFPIILRLNNTLADPNKKYSSSYPHLDSWAGQPENSKILSFNVLTGIDSPTLEILTTKNKKKISKNKKKQYKNIIKSKDIVSLYKTKQADLSILDAGTLHRTSKGKSFRITLECRFIEKGKLKKSDPKNLKKYYFKRKTFFKINQKNTVILNKFGEIAKSRFGVDFEFRHKF